jgi:hypothetical protein
LKIWEILIKIQTAEPFGISMKLRQLVVVSVSLLLLSSLFLNLFSLSSAQVETAPDVYVGIDMGYGTDVAGAKAAIDKVSNLTNFFILGTYALSTNLTKLNETLQYAYDKGMYFMSYPPNLSYSNSTNSKRMMNASLSWLNYTKTNWNNHLLGFMYPYEDEPGGHQIDKAGVYRAVPNMNATNYTDAENQYLNSMWFWDLNRTKNVVGYPLFSSDYALYWFDYKGGYDGLFAEFVWNYSRQINVALCRGAATVQNKQWGVIIAYQSTTPPYVESGETLYNDLVYAYDNGAKYIVILDTNSNWTGPCLTEEHYQTMKQFWQHIQSNPRNAYPASERVAYMLPEAYAYGFRGAEDSIWGVWNVDMNSFLMSTSVGILLDKYGSKLDIIYNETIPGYDTIYQKIIPWNDPEGVAKEWPSYAPWYSPSPSATPGLTITPTNDPNVQQPFAVNYLWVAVIALTTAGIAGTLLIFKRRFRFSAI